jgi:hypothetical protein
MAHHYPPPMLIAVYIADLFLLTQAYSYSRVPCRHFEVERNPLHPRQIKLLAVVTHQRNPPEGNENDNGVCLGTMMNDVR